MQGRRSSMEDSHVSILQLPHRTDTGLVGILDGHGGAAAASFIANKLPVTIERLGDFRPSTVQQSFLDLDKEYLLSDPLAATTGSTCCVAVLQPGAHACWSITMCSVGDSRALLLRKDGNFISLTEDHKPEIKEETLRIIRAGGRVTSHGSCCRVDGGLAMSRAFGDGQYKSRADLLPHQQKVIALPDVTTYTAFEGDTLLIACDGVWERLQDQDVARFAQKYLLMGSHPETAARGLIREALASGSGDNLSCLLVKFGSACGHSIFSSSLGLSL
jgi:serine/threonine protein phosphatase PrpC